MQLTNLMDPVKLTRQMIDIPSVSGEEGPLADAVEAALRLPTPRECRSSGA